MFAANMPDPTTQLKLLSDVQAVPSQAVCPIRAFGLSPEAENDCPNIVIIFPPVVGPFVSDKELTTTES